LPPLIVNIWVDAMMHLSRLRLTPRDEPAIECLRLQSVPPGEQQVEPTLDLLPPP
jgi:hypothetical protein